MLRFLITVLAAAGCAHGAVLLRNAAKGLPLTVGSATPANLLDGATYSAVLSANYDLYVRFLRLSVLTSPPSRRRALTTCASSRPPRALSLRPSTQHAHCARCVVHTTRSIYYCTAHTSSSLRRARIPHHLHISPHGLPHPLLHFFASLPLRLSALPLGVFTDGRKRMQVGRH